MENKAEGGDAVQLSRRATELQKQLVQQPSLCCERDLMGRTLLHAAAELGDCESLSVLLAAGAEWQQQDKSGLTAGELAFAGKHQKAFDLLVAAGCAATRAARAGQGRKRKLVTRNMDYLQQKLAYQDDCLLDAAGSGVMMGWEAHLMEAHAKELLPGDGTGAVLNVGFGLGLVDNYLQQQRPRSHSIIEAHPDVLAEMERRGWMDKEGVTVHRGRWQDILPKLPAASFDAVFFDTYEESYADLREFQAHLQRLLREGGRFSFFNGCAPYNIFFHGVYLRLAQEDLASLGFVCDVYPLQVGALGDSTWQQVSKRYWAFKTYYLPIVRRASDRRSEKDTWRQWPASAIQVDDDV